MYRPTFAAILLSTSLLAGGAWAQSAAPADTATSGKFVTAQGATEFKASKFVGIDVYGTEGEKIGDISEVLLDASGNAKAVVVGVGGFLGIGQKNVAIPWSAVTWVNEPPASRSAAAPERPATTGATAPAGAPANAPRPPASAPARSPAEQAAYNGYPDHAKVQLSKAELNDAPAFRYASDAPSAAAKQ